MHTGVIIITTPQKSLIVCNPLRGQIGEWLRQYGGGFMTKSTQTFQITSDKK